MVVLIFSIFIGIFLGKVFIERYRELRKFVVSEKFELSLFGIGLALLSLEMYFIPKVFKSFRLSLLRSI
ncbi:hypothetical protein HRbin37_01123 [bacterium HR37]|nr:hypothetical protein HRbin37_01123 [bacterium HR37]